MIWFVISAALVAAAAGWIVSPLWSRGRSPIRADKSQELLEQRMAIYRSMLDLELDHSTGKVSDEDFAMLREEHESEALSIIHQDTDREGAEPGPPDLLEVEIAEARRRLAEGR